MTALPHAGMTLASFLAWEERQELRWEFDGQVARPMQGDTVAHATVHANLTSALVARLRGSPFIPFGALKLRTRTGIRYPDAFVAPKPVNPRATVRDDAIVVFEVLSPRTDRIDRVEKMREYWDTPSIRHYVLIEQDAISATSHLRESGRWSGRVLWAGDVIALPEIGIEIPLEDLYEGLDPEALRSPARADREGA